MAKLPFLNSKITKNFWGDRKIKRNNFSFRPKFKFQMNFELQFQEAKRI
jgi:hypothetical protein